MRSESSLNYILYHLVSIVLCTGSAMWGCACVCVGWTQALPTDKYTLSWWCNKQTIEQTNKQTIEQSNKQWKKAKLELNQSTDRSRLNRIEKHWYKRIAEHRKSPTEWEHIWGIYG